MTRVFWIWCKDCRARLKVNDACWSIRDNGERCKTCFARYEGHDAK